MRRFAKALALLLVVGTVTACFGILPDGFYIWLGEALPGPVSDVVFTTAGIRQAERADHSAAQDQRPAFAGSAGAPSISAQVVDGVMNRQEGIKIPVMLPKGSDEDVTKYLLRQVELAIDSMRRDKPEVFWISLGSYVIEWTGNRESGEGELIVHIGYSYSASEVSFMEEKMEQVIDEVLKDAPLDPAQAVTYFHDWIVTNTIYASDLTDDSSSMQGYEYGFNIDGVFLKGRAVCEGYSKALKLLCDRAGIPCKSVFGVANGENHSWNYVQLDDQWYLVDATWDDPVGFDNILLHHYLLKGFRSVIDGQTVGEIYHNDYASYPTLARYGYDDLAS